MVQSQSEVQLFLGLGSQSGSFALRITKPVKTNFCAFAGVSLIDISREDNTLRGNSRIIPSYTVHETIIGGQIGVMSRLMVTRKFSLQSSVAGGIGWSQRWATIDEDMLHLTENVQGHFAVVYFTGALHGKYEISKNIDILAGFSGVFSLGDSKVSGLLGNVGLSYSLPGGK